MTLLSQRSPPGLSGDSDSDSLDSLGSDSEVDERAGEGGGRPSAAEMTAVLGEEGRWRWWMVGTGGGTGGLDWSVRDAFFMRCGAFRHDAPRRDFNNMAFCDIFCTLR